MVKYSFVFLGFGISVEPAEVKRQYDRGFEPSTSKKCDIVIKCGNVYTKFLRIVNTKMCVIVTYCLDSVDVVLTMKILPHSTVATLCNIAKQDTIQIGNECNFNEEIRELNCGVVSRITV